MSTPLTLCVVVLARHFSGYFSIDLPTSCRHTANIGNAARATQSHDIDLSLESAWEFRSPFEPGRTRVLSSCGGEVLKLLDRKAAGASRSERRDLYPSVSGRLVDGLRV